MDSKFKVSVIVRSYNEELHIKKLFEGIKRQKFENAEVETILVDSGSEDETLEIADQYPVKVVHIKPEEFSFGYSLNKGIENSTGDYIVLISAHCYPVNDNWLEQLVSPLKDVEETALTYGKQRGYHTSYYSEHQIFRKWFPEEVNGTQNHPFCNNANAAVKRALWERFRYDETLTGLEDLDWGRRVSAEGYRVVYVPDAEIIHIHNETYRKVFNRYRREAMAYRKIYPGEKFSFVDFIKLFFLNSFSDYFYAASEGKLFKNILKIPLFRFCQLYGTYRGYKRVMEITGELRKIFYYPPDISRKKEDR